MSLLIDATRSTAEEGAAALCPRPDEIQDGESHFGRCQLCKEGWGKCERRTKIFEAQTQITLEKSFTHKFCLRLIIEKENE